jgi:hypothetical protein
MFQSQKLDLALDRLEGELWAANAQKQYALFGSASLVLRGILDREPGDIDVHVTKRVWGTLLARPNWYWETPKAGDPPILALDASITIHAFFEWSDTFVEMDVPALISNAEDVPYGGNVYRCIPVIDALQHKRDAVNYDPKKSKHIPDIQIIEEYLLTHA